MVITTHYDTDFSNMKFGKIGTCETKLILLTSRAIANFGPNGRLGKFCKYPNSMTKKHRKIGN